MSIYTTHRSGTDQWSQPMQPADPSVRLARYGKLQPMDEPSLFDRLFRRQN